MRLANRSELLAEAIVARVLDRPVEHIDGKGQQREVDALIDLGNGHIGALEVTRMGDPAQFELLATLDREGWQWPSRGAWSWMLGVRHLHELPRLRVVVPRAVTQCEEYGVGQPSALPFFVLNQDRELWWLAWETESSLQGLPSPTSLAGTIVLTMGGRGGVIPSSWDGLSSQVERLLATDNGVKHVKKLRERDGVEERHLFRIVTGDALPFGLYHRLMRADAAPGEPLSLPDVIDAVWLGVGTWSVLRYARASGWSVHNLSAEPLGTP